MSTKIGSRTSRRNGTKNALRVQCQGRTRHAARRAVASMQGKVRVKAWVPEELPEWERGAEQAQREDYERDLIERDYEAENDFYDEDGKGPVQRAYEAREQHEKDYRATFATLEPAYDSMTRQELYELGKKHNIIGVTAKLRKPQLVQMVTHYFVCDSLSLPSDFEPQLTKEN